MSREQETERRGDIITYFVRLCVGVFLKSLFWQDTKVANVLVAFIALLQQTLALAQVSFHALLLTSDTTPILSLLTARFLKAGLQVLSALAELIDLFVDLCKRSKDQGVNPVR